ncbi:hypothetical protein [Albidovulum sediminis]|uniref:Uncharacterized protein n=1 Tax=Albidovulum sediminis TaxID=3066345 RepID=A0ABT2NKB1_9RHOB|nr:hypothetical protein [Defluviimonas sediminis]MCT8329351.1 hypothetical protein [Defluviimonas sediminis]
MTMFSMKPQFNLAEFLAANGPRERPTATSKPKRRSPKVADHKPTEGHGAAKPEKDMK